jgi:hypothetical protein
MTDQDLQSSRNLWGQASERPCAVDKMNARQAVNEELFSRGLT